MCWKVARQGRLSHYLKRVGLFARDNWIVLSTTLGGGGVGGYFAGHDFAEYMATPFTTAGTLKLYWGLMAAGVTIASPLVCGFGAHCLDLMMGGKKRDARKEKLLAAHLKFQKEHLATVCQNSPSQALRALSGQISAHGANIGEEQLNAIIVSIIKDASLNTPEKRTEELLRRLNEAAVKTAISHMDAQTTGLVEHIQRLKNQGIAEFMAAKNDAIRLLTDGRPDGELDTFEQKIANELLVLNHADAQRNAKVDAIIELVKGLREHQLPEALMNNPQMRQELGLLADQPRDVVIVMPESGEMHEFTEITPLLN